MSKETRQAHTERLRVLESVRGHDSTIARTWNHSDGQCPKCSSQQHHIRYCYPAHYPLPCMPTCELDGEHLHRVCGACQYAWIERCFDQFMEQQERGEFPAEAELARVIAAVVHRTGGICLDQAMVTGYRGWILRFERNQELGTVTVTTEPGPVQTGTPAHPRIQSEEGGLIR